MIEKSSTPTFRGPVSKSTAAEILEQAANLDAVGDEMIDLEELRLAARDAGISTRAFDLSLAEIRKRREASEPPTRPSAQESAAGVDRPRVSYGGMIGAGAISGLLTWGMAVITMDPFLVDQQIPGMMLGGAGVLAGVLAYARTTLRKRD